MKNKIKFSALMLLLFSSYLLSAQKYYQFKLYNSMLYSSNTANYPSFGFEQTTRNTQLLKLMPGFAVNKGRSCFDIFISSLSHQNTIVNSRYTDTSGRPDFKYRTTSFNLGLQLIKSWHLNPEAKKRVNFFLGVSLEPLFSKYRTTPYYTESIKTRLTNYTLNTYFIPRIRYMLNSKFSLELNIPVKMVQMIYQRQWADNPQFNANQKITSNSSITGFPRQLMLNLGIACKI